MLLRRATDATASGTRQAFLDFWRHECSAHFRVEEEVLFPVHAEYAGEHDVLLRRALDDHVEIRRRADELAATEGPSGRQLNELGETLAAHVRLEERELFPAIERTLPPERLAAVGAALAEAERMQPG